VLPFERAISIDDLSQMVVGKSSLFRHDFTIYIPCPSSYDLVDSSDATMSETLCRAFPNREKPLISYGLPFTDAVLRYLSNESRVAKVYVICSGSLARNTSYLEALSQQLGDRIVGTRVGMRSHSFWSEILEVVEAVKRCGAEYIITLGAGSLTDAAKVVSYVCCTDFPSKRIDIFKQEKKPCPLCDSSFLSTYVT
jgi:hypothetical protein